LFLKVVSTEDDWIMRVTGNEHWAFQVWRAGLYQRVPSVRDPAMIRMALDDSGGATRLARGWALLQERDTVLFELVSAVHRDPSTLAELLSETPRTFIAGDWKMGNLGTRSR
jgi:hypothetical protein